MMRRGDLSLALLGSVALHAGVLVALPSPSAQIAGGAEQAAVVLGAAFEDLAIGAIATDDTSVEGASQTIPKISPLADVTPARAVKTRPVTTAQTASIATRTQIDASRTAHAARSTEVAKNVTPGGTAEGVALDRSVAPNRPPDTLNTVRAVSPIEFIRGRDIAVTPVEKSLRPVARPTAPSKEGSAKKRAKKGSTAPIRRTDQQAGAERAVTAQQAGNAAADNYPGAIMRAIRRVPQARVRGKGKVVLAFTINGKGHLANLSVRHSSGDTQIDRAALAHLRLAAPFPAPPPGAKQRFSVPITYR